MKTEIKKTLADVKALNRVKGFHFFDAKTMRFFASRVHGGLHKEKYFITSEKTSFTSNNRRFTIRVVNWDTGNINSVRGFLEFKSVDDAKAYIMEAL